MEECRNGHSAEDGLRARLVEGLEERFKSIVGKLGSKGAWVGFLWNENARRLYSAFGQFAQPAWNARFAVGDGVAGHAFRFGKPAFWHTNGTNSESLIFRRRTELEGPYAHDYSWVVCFPILDGFKAPIGVVSFASPDSGSAAEKKLGSLAERVCTDTKNADDNSFVEKLWNAINAGFWSVLKEHDNKSIREFASAAISKMAGPTEES